MTPETEKLIAQFPELTIEQAKLIFIRKSAQEAYEKDEIRQTTLGQLKEIVETATCSSMSRDDIGKLIADLELARNYLAAFTQGLMKAHASKVEPEIKAKREKERKEKLLKRANSGASKSASDLMAMALKAVESGAKVEISKELSVQKIGKVTCEKCKKEVFSLKFHKC